VTGVSSEHVRRAVSDLLGCQPRRTSDGLEWRPKPQPGIRWAVLRPASGGLQQLDVVLADAHEEACSRVHSLWAMAAMLLKESDLTVIPILPRQDGDKWQIMARLTLRDAVLDLPRLNRLSLALELLDKTAKALQAALPLATGPVQEVPRQLKGMVEPLAAQLDQDSGSGNVSESIAPLLKAGLTVAMVGTPLRTRLELDRLARIAKNLAVLQRMVPIQDLPQLARVAKEGGLVLALPCGLLRPRMSVYEQGRELEAALRELAAHGLAALTFGTREDLEATFGVGQGRNHTPLFPTIHTLPEARYPDLARAALAGRCVGLSRADVDSLVRLVVHAVEEHPAGNEQLLQPLANLAAERGPNHPDLPRELASLAQDLAGRRDTFGTCEEAPASPRQPDVCRLLRRRLGGPELENLLRVRILGQDDAISELTKRIWQEAICRPGTEPLRLMLAGPVGTGKSIAAKRIAQVLGWPYHYIDAASFDSEHAVMTSLAGASPGIVNSYNDGVLAKISRRPSVVEVADLDHAQPAVRGALCEFFLRALQEGTLQTGSGMIVRTLPSVIFIFTSNIAYGARKASSSFGFGHLSRRDIRQRVVANTLDCLGHAFMSRVGEPILFDEFTRQAALKLVEMEIQTLVGRVTGATTILTSPDVTEQILDSLLTLEAGARGVIDATRSALADALRGCADMAYEQVEVRLTGRDIAIVPVCDAFRGESLISADEQDQHDQTAAESS